MGLDNLICTSDDADTRAAAASNSEDVTMNTSKIWATGEFEFEADMRRLDNAVCIPYATHIPQYGHYNYRM